MYQYNIFLCVNLFASFSRYLYLIFDFRFETQKAGCESRYLTKMTFTPNTLVFNGITKLLHFDTRWEDDEEILNFIRNSFELNENTEFNIVQLTQPFEGYVPPSLLKKPSDIEFRIDVIHRKCRYSIF